MPGGDISRGRPGPLLSVGLPLLLLVLGVRFASQRYTAVQAARANTPGNIETSNPTPGSAEVAALGTLRIALQPHSEQGALSALRIAGDSWSGYAPLRSDATLRANLAKRGVELEYINGQSLAAPSIRLEALLRGEIDIALVPLASAVLAAPDARSRLSVLALLSESTGGDVVFAHKSVTGKLPTDATACVVEDSAGAQLWSLWSHALPNFGRVKALNAASSQQCWEKLSRAETQFAVLREPQVAIAEREGYRRIVSTREADEHAVFDVFVARRDAPGTRLGPALSATLDSYFARVRELKTNQHETEALLLRDCGALCTGDATLGSKLFASTRWLDAADNQCAWFGACSGGPTLREAARRIFQAWGTREVNETENADFDTLFDSRLLPKTAEANTQTSAPMARRYDVSRGLAPAIAPEYLGVLGLPTLRFAADSFQLEADARAMLRGWAVLLRRLPGFCLRIKGWSPAREEARARNRLGKLRAYAVANELTRMAPEMFPEARFDLVATRAEVGAPSNELEIGLVTCGVE